MDKTIISENISRDDVTFTVDQVSEFLAAVGRGNSCPLCPHEGNWYFHTTPGSGKIAVHNIPHDGKQDTFTPVAIMECPNCGFSPMFSLTTVRDYFRTKTNG